MCRGIGDQGIYGRRLRHKATFMPSHTRASRSPSVPVHVTAALSKNRNGLTV